MKNAPDIPAERFFAMTTLDENRAKYQLSLKSKIPVENIHNMIIWGNHSGTQVVDYYNAKIAGKSAIKVINDINYLQNDFTTTIINRGGAVINTRGKSSAASAANALIDKIKSLIYPKKDDYFSLGISSDNNPYNIPNGLIFSFPCSLKDGKHYIVKGLKWDDFLTKKIKLTIEELLKEKEIVKDLL